MNYGSFIGHHDNPSYKLLQDNYKLRQKNYYKLQQFYYKLRQWVIKNDSKNLLQITNYVKKLQSTAALVFEKFKILDYFKFYFKYILRQFLSLLQITEDFITNYGRYYKLRHYYKLRRDSIDQRNR